jgi:nitrate reductase assembly molybdenum cofactor insertion protein NarJ/Pyruvate/2-oxoacid:ferredoxin oxidoreductase delta subunit
MINLMSKNLIIEKTNSIYLDLALLLGINTESDIPEWFTRAGVEWPVYHAAKEINESNPTRLLSDALIMIEKILPVDPESIWRCFENLRLGKDCPILWLNESKYKDGRIPGPTTFQVKSLYKKVGLAAVGSELPDHASMELEFLAFLSNQRLVDDTINSPWDEAHSLFLKKHIMSWLPKVSNQLSKQGNHTWASVGVLLKAVLSLDFAQQPREKVIHGIPSIQNADECSLCGFCVQVCPSNALQVIEDQTSTALWLSEKLCTQCSKCKNICPEKVISLHDTPRGNTPKLLMKSPRVACTKCNQMMISKAELDYTASKLDNPAWLFICLDCRI